MLSRYFGFQEEPFGATPDPRWLYRSARHREALASLRYGFLSNRGFTALIGPPGLGKTTLLFQFLHDIRNSTRIVFLFDTQCEPPGLLRYILRDLGIAPAVNGDEMHVQLEDVLVKEARAGRRVVVVVDEAQNLSDESLEMLRLLTNYETPRAKLLHIVLSGQPLLADTLMKPSMEQLRQRVTTSCWLEPFSIEETTAYIRHRLEQAGYRGAPLFRKDALRRIMVASHGIPRLINNLCFNALSLCCEQKRQQVDGSMAAEAIAIQELDPESRKKITARWELAAGQPLQPRQSIQPEQLLRPEQPIQREKLLQPEQPHQTAQVLRPKQPLQLEQLLRPEQPAQAEEPEPVLRRLMVPAAAVLLAALGIGVFSLSAGWQPWSHQTGYIQSLNTKFLSASGPQSSQPNISTRIVAAPSSKPSPLNTNDLFVAIPAPATAKIGKVTVAEPPAKTEPSATKVVSPPVPAPAVANIDRVTVAEPPVKTTPSATKVVSPPVPAPAVANIDRVTVAEPPAKIKRFQITAEPDETLQNICVRYLGICDLKRRHEIQALNPNLTDLDHIQAGQKIWLPAPEPAPIVQPSSAQAHLNQVPGASSNANVTPSATTAAIRNPAGGNRGAVESPHVAGKVANAGLPSATGTARAGSYGKVASAGIPGVVKATARVKIPVAPVPDGILPKSTESSNPAEQDTPNCGGTVEMPCPKLQIRPTPPPD
jgi:type II secretory pathway predicted ATPase ExeA